MTTMFDPVAAQFPEYPAHFFHHNNMSHIVQGVVGGKKSTNPVPALNFIDGVIHQRNPNGVSNAISNRVARDFADKFLTSLGVDYRSSIQASGNLERYRTLLLEYHAMKESYDNQPRLVAEAGRRVAEAATARAQQAKEDAEIE
ncbi:MAG TPA: hypothetical protein VN457_06430, partial [Chlamydiales bacterium]|nr:hypothetical protein [Chlamydiales bacterium]